MKISIIIANYNGEKYIDTCLRSVLANEYKNYEILIVDDGSSDASIAIINQFIEIDERIALFRNKSNLGASASRNLAIHKAKGEILVFLDNDTQVAKDWLVNLIEPLKDKEVGATQSVLLDFHKRKLIQNAGGKFMPQTGWLLPHYQWQEYVKVKDKLQGLNIGAISASLAVRKEVLDRIGGFDEKEAVTTEDLDFVWRIWITGWKVILAYDSVAYHWTKDINERKSMNTNMRKMYYHLAKNSFRSIVKNYEARNVIKYLPISVAINSGRGVFYLIKHKDSSSFFGSIQALTWFMVNIKDTLISRKFTQRSRLSNDSDIIDIVFDKNKLTKILKKYYL